MGGRILHRVITWVSTRVNEEDAPAKKLIMSLFLSTIWARCRNTWLNLQFPQRKSVLQSVKYEKLRTDRRCSMRGGLWFGAVRGWKFSGIFYRSGYILGQTAYTDCALVRKDWSQGRHMAIQITQVLRGCNRRR